MGMSKVVGGALAIFTIVILASVVTTFIADQNATFGATEQLILGYVPTFMVLGALVTAGYLAIAGMSGRRR